MKKTIILALALALIGGAAYANFCARDTVPAATLLVPYIVIDTDANGVPVTNGNDTITVVSNVSSAKQIIHVTVYSADSTPVIDFDEVLSGYDVWQINWRDLVTGAFSNFDTGVSSTGFFPTAAVGPAPQPYGPTANNWDYTVVANGSIPGPVDTDKTNAPTSPKPPCGFPWGNQAQYATLILQGLQGPLYSVPAQDTDCSQANGNEINVWHGWLGSLGDNPLFFYAYIDAVSACNQHFPGDQEYWTAPYGGIASPAILTDNNVLTGYDIYLNALNGQNYSESLPTVNVEAWAGHTGIGLYSPDKYVYGTATNPLTDREPLPTAWAFNFLNNGGVTTDVAVWKNYDDFVIKSGAYIAVSACRPYIYYAFDENEQSLASTTQVCPSPNIFCLAPEPNVFPFQTQKVPVTSANFDGLPTTGTLNFGWMLLVFDPSIPNLNPTYHVDTMLQTYVFARYNWGTYSTSVEATVMSNAFCTPTQQLPQLGANAGGGEFNYGILYQ